MTKGTILITDTLFVSSDDEEVIRNAGYECERLDVPRASEDQLIKAIRGKVGYILGGVESVTESVVEAADSLRAIAFTGAGYREFIPSHERATKKGIAIANAPGGNATAVVEYTLALMLLMTRGVLSLGRTGEESFRTTVGLRGQTVGILGLGNIGTWLCMGLRPFGVDEVLYYSRSRKYHLESPLAVRYAAKEDLLVQSDIVSLHVSKEAGRSFLSLDDLEQMKPGSLLINVAYPDAVDFDALRPLLEKGQLRAAFDAPPDGDYSDLPPSSFFCSNAQTAFNTSSANATVSSMVVRSMLNLLESGDDLFLVNPGYARKKG